LFSGSILELRGAIGLRSSNPLNFVSQEKLTKA
jgi:hypothetical protein